jgi:hypothetical protein
VAGAVTQHLGLHVLADVELTTMSDLPRVRGLFVVSQARQIVRRPVELGTKNLYAGEGLQQFRRRLVVYQIMVNSISKATR